MSEKDNNRVIENTENSVKKGLDINVKFFITSCIIIFALMCLVYGLTFVIPSGEYARVLDENGNTIIDTAKGFSYIDGGISFVKWILSPILVLGAEGSGTILTIIGFLLVVGGLFNVLDKCGLMKRILNAIVKKFSKSRYKLLAITILFFMLMGSFLGSFEECVPLVPVVVALSVAMGWDALTGLGMSILAAGCGFAAGVCNPFTVGVAQGLAGLALFSGVWYRFIGFIVIYILLLVFIYRYAKKVEKPLENLVNADNISKATPIEKSPIKLLTFFWDGLSSVLPAILMILMASSIKYTLEEAKVLDTILYMAVDVAGSLPKWAVILFIYLIVLIMNFFISSGSAKAFLLMPLIVPIAQIFGISAQLCVMAFAFGDGFSNVFYPTNPVLLISLGLANVSYGKWAKWTWKFQTVNLLITSLLLLVGLYIGY